MRWQYAILYPCEDSENEWKWMDHTLFGLSALDRITLTVKRAGVKYIRLSETSQFKSSDLSWTGEPDDEEPILLIRGGTFWKTELLNWFDEKIDSDERPTYLTLPDGVPFLASCSYRLWKEKFASLKTFPEQSNSEIQQLPSHLIPVPYRSEEGILELAGKPSDRPHVVWVRRKLLPLLRFCSEKGITPNTITWSGFAVHVIGCLMLIPKSYFTGILATLVLALSWVLDCADGSLARVAMKESPYGKKLDTFLGNISNITLFIALIVREYGDRPFAAIFFTLAILSGIVIAYRIHEKIPKISTSKIPSGISGLLTKINHRDYTLVLFLLAIFDGFKLFIWLSLIGVHVYWITDLIIKSGGPEDLITRLKKILRRS